ncbi:MAG TPA: SMP-30/gluconolactonase/LRE family protein [Burkholderiaceae bacterium]|jgi:sugar lactone lactonase YvrE|nr:SMP-30/gluconolactonase/LRE family protein [Burkholderiaceae bacterium]
MSERLSIEVDCVVDSRNIVGESPVWSARDEALYWVDIPQGLICRWQPRTGEQRSWRVPAAVGSIGLREQGGLVLAMRSGFHLFDLDTEQLTFLCHPEPDIPTNRLNDGKVSPEGRFWAGTMDDRPQREPTGSLYRLDADHRCTRLVDGIRVSNGLAWSPDGRTMYHSDSRGGAIFRHAYDPDSGALGPRETFASMLPEWGRPDGGATDEEGCYWGCGISAGRINRFSPSGELIGYVELPVTHPTMPCFGGPRLRTLYVTSLREGLAPEALERTPQAGSIFALDPGVAGTPVARYRG